MAQTPARKLSIDRKSATDWLACVGQTVHMTVKMENGVGNMYAHVEGEQHVRLPAPWSRRSPSARTPAG